MPVEKPRLVSYRAEVDHDEVQRERRDGEVEPAQAQARQTEDEPERGADQGGGGQRDPERRAELLEQDPGRERTRREEARVAERDLPGVAGQQHQRHRADGGEQHLVREVERERAGEERVGDERDGEDERPHLARAGTEQREVVRVAGAEVAARARRAHTRSSSSRDPKSPQGRTTSIASRMKNGTTSASSAST
ncbi:MAG: hypothetical protein M5U08_23475 [Burkholderiales bacterium]|nr:hypothetical protein [Burkholderiales bacterium]